MPLDRRIRVPRQTRGHPDLDPLVLLEGLLATDWYESLAEAIGGDEGELLRAVGHDAVDQAEELRRALALWERTGGEAGAARLKPRLDAELLDLVREIRARTADLLDAASERAPSAEVAERLRELARGARSHAERLAEAL